MKPNAFLKAFLAVLSLFFFLITAGCSGNGRQAGEDGAVSIIPFPSQTIQGKGFFKPDRNTVVTVDSTHQALHFIAAELAEKIHRATGYKPKVVSLNKSQDTHRNTSGEVKNAITLALEENAPHYGQEGYRLDVKETGIRIEAGKPAGLFYGYQTLRQLLPPEIEGNEPGRTRKLQVPVLTILDKPAFRWRGMHLDVGRHFMKVETVKRYIDLMAYYKLNRFHWHLTEDQGWRIEIKKYPRLTSVGAWRKAEDGSGNTYGGFYTQKEIKEIVEYAAQRHIVVVPEIEMPGHTMAALAAYPEYSCTGGPFEVQTQWGVHKDVFCAGNDNTFQFLEDILTEVMELFPSTYIHIGGDECPKDRWKACTACQKRIREENLEDEHQLQSYFIKRIETFLKANDRRLIGWDEILEGGPAPGATVQSWRGMDGAVAAAKAGHDTIVSPNNYAYFDHSIDNTDLREVYSFEPVPKELTPEQARHIIGGECCIWTERITEDNIDHMVFPRLTAMAEILWSHPAEKNFIQFHRRLGRHYPRLDRLGVKYGPEARPLTIHPTFIPQKKSFSVRIEAGIPGIDIYYTTDGNYPDKKSRLYTNPIKIDAPVTLKAMGYNGDKPYGEVVEKTFYYHKALGKPYTLAYPYSDKYEAGAQWSLTDGLTGSENFRDGFWQGYEEKDLEVVIDMEKETEISRVRISFYQQVHSWIHMPGLVKIETSPDGKQFTVIAHREPKTPAKHPDTITETFDFSLEKVRTRYLRITAQNIGTNPEWHYAPDGKAWIFVDEIILE